MELRQLRYFIRVVELGSMGRAAAEMSVQTSAVSQQISRLESELSTRLLQRSKTGVVPTDAGLAFLREAQLTMRHASDAVHAAQHARLSGYVSIGLPPSTASVLGVPLLKAMRDRYPQVRLHLVEALSGHLGAMLNARQLDLALVFRGEVVRRWSVMPLLDERLFLVGRADLPGMPAGPEVRLAELSTLPLILPTGTHGMRVLVDTAFMQAKIEPSIAAEIDGLALLMDAVRAGLGVTLQPSAAVAREPTSTLRSLLVADAEIPRQTLLASASDNELAPAALAARVVLADVARELVRSGHWPGATLHDR